MPSKMHQELRKGSHSIVFLGKNLHTAALRILHNHEV
jgi:hypothetical protein